MRIKCPFPDCDKCPYPDCVKGGTSTQKERKGPSDRKQYQKQYYLDHREKLLQRAKERYAAATASK